MAELREATGSRIAHIFANESEYGVVKAASPVFRRIPVIGGESMDSNFRTYESQIILENRTSQQTQIGTQDPGGELPGELRVEDAFLCWHLLGGPITPTGAGPYVHAITGHPDIVGESAGNPVSFSYEKQFLNLGTGIKKYTTMVGCRVDSLAIDAVIDRFVNRTWGIIGRSFTPSVTSMNTGAAPAFSSIDAFKPTQIVMTLGGSPVASTGLRLNIRNNFYRDRGYELGSTLRQSLQPGTRTVMGSIDVRFTDTVYYEQAIAGNVDAALNITFSDGTYGCVISMPKVRLLPNNSVPKQTDDGPLTTTFDFKAVYDPTAQYDVRMTWTIPTAVLTT